MALMIRSVSIVLEQRGRERARGCDLLLLLLFLLLFIWGCIISAAASAHPSVCPSIHASIDPSIHPSISTARPQNLPGAASLSVASCLGDERPRDASKHTFTEVAGVVS